MKLQCCAVVFHEVDDGICPFRVLFVIKQLRHGLDPDLDEVDDRLGQLAVIIIVGA